MSWRRPVFVLVLSAVLLVARPAHAHTEVARATPGPAETVDAGVDEVELAFLDPVLPGLTIDVTDPDGRSVAGLSATELTDGDTTASATFDPLDDGAYVVRATFVALDGDQQDEVYRFTVEAEEDGTTPAIAVAVGGLLVGLLAVALVRRRRRTAA